MDPLPLWCFLHLQQLLIPVLLMLPASWTTGVSGDHYGEFIFDGFFGNDLTMDGEAIVSDGLLRLTSGQNTSEGHAFYTYPLNFTSDIVLNGSSVPSFSTTFVFAIVPEYSGLGGHGLAFVLSSTKELFTALPSQYPGLLNAWSMGNTSNHLLAIELDTVKNFEFDDIDSNHIGIDVNSLVSMTSHTAGCYTPDGEFYPLSLISTKPMQVWVDYDSKHTILNVTIAPYNSMSTKPSKPLLSVPCNLSSILPTTAVYAGFSSASGLLDSKHYIIGWSFKLDGEAAPLNYSALSLKTIQAQAQQIGVRRPHGYKTIICIVLLPTVAISILTSAVIVEVHMRRRIKARATW